MKLIALPIAALLCATVVAQNPAAARAQLAKKETAAAKDPEALMRVGVWAREQGLADDAKRIFAAVLKLKPDHKAANEALGNVQFEGKWVEPKEAERLRLVAEMTAKGLVSVDGVWVPKDDAEAARKGIFKYRGESLTKGEYEEFAKGKVRHPITGEPIDEKDLEQARSRHFPVGDDGRWVDEKEADGRHADLRTPWIVRTKDYVWLSTLPIATLEQLREHADRAIERLRPIIGFADPLPKLRPVVMVASSSNEFQQLGNGLGDAASAFGAFLAADERTVKVRLQGDVRPAVCLWDEGWGPYYLPHATALAYVESLCAELDTEVPDWFRHAMGAYASRFVNAETGAWFAQRLAQAGGVRDLATWFHSFALNGSMEFNDLDATVTHAGFLISFCIDGRNADALAALQEVTKAFSGRKASGIDKAIKGLQSTLARQQGPISDYLVALVKKGG